MKDSEDSKAGDSSRSKLDELIELLYPELQRLAAKYFNRERADHTLQPTALVHEAYERLVKQTRGICKSRTHFFAASANIMRRILTEHARKRRALKRGGMCGKEPLMEKTDPAVSVVDIVALDEALTKLASLDERAARVMELHHFGGLTLKEIAEYLDVSERTVAGDWKFAKALLEKELGESR